MLTEGRSRTMRVSSPSRRSRNGRHWGATQQPARHPCVAGVAETRTARRAGVRPSTRSRPIVSVGRSGDSQNDHGRQREGNRPPKKHEQKDPFVHLRPSRLGSAARARPVRRPGARAADAHVSRRTRRMSRGPRARCRNPLNRVFQPASRRIAECAVCLGDLSEAGGGLAVSRVGVGVELTRKPPVRAADVFVAGARRQAERTVRIVGSNGSRVRAHPTSLGPGRVCRRLERSDERQVSILLGVVQAVADDEFVRDVEPDVPKVQLDLLNA